LARLRDFYLFLSLSVLFLALLWPALWVDPLHLFGSISHFSSYFLNRDTVPYLGRYYPLDQAPWHYLPMHLAAVTPVISLLAVLAGAIGSLRQLFARQNAFGHAVLWSWLLIPLLARLTPGTIQYDGMRHVFLIV